MIEIEIYRKLKLQPFWKNQVKKIQIKNKDLNNILINYIQIIQWFLNMKIWKQEIKLL